MSLKAAFPILHKGEAQVKKNKLFSCQRSCHRRKALPQSQGSQLAGGSGQGVAEGSGTGLNSCWSLTLPAHGWWEWQSCVFGARGSKRSQLLMLSGKKINPGREWNWYKNPISPSLLYFTLVVCKRLEFVRVRGLVRTQLTVRKRDLGRVVFYAPAASELQWYELEENWLKKVGFW